MRMTIKENGISKKYLNEKDYGYLKKDDFNLIVSLGYGTWGPSIIITTIYMVIIKYYTIFRELC